MGRPNSQPGFNQSSTVSSNNQSSTSINHFSHPHPLQLSYPQSQQPFPASSCSGCKLEASGSIYSCMMCNYFLHPKCSQMPQKITHPFDQNGHVLSLLTKPAYAEGLFKCDACAQDGNGFSYHCQDCGIDLHILCASLPMAFRHSSHPHPLNLTFSPPYPSKTFSCDLCKMAGSKYWLYRCNSCEFDVHLSCVNMQPRTSVQPPSQQSLMQQLQTLMARSTIPQPSTPQRANIMPNMMSTVNPVALNSFGQQGGFVQPQNQHQVFGSPFAATTPMQNPMQPNNLLNSGTYGSLRPASQGNDLMNKVLGGIASGASQAIAGALVHDLLNGSGGNNGGTDGGYGGGDTSSFTADNGGYGGGDNSTATAPTY